MQLPEIHNYSFDNTCHVDPDALHPLTTASLEATNRSYADDRGTYISETYAAVQRTPQGVPYAHFHNEGDSRTDVVLTITPFGTPIAPRHAAEDMVRFVEDRAATTRPENIEPNDANKLFQARLLYDTLKHAGVTDPDGNYISVIAVASPSLDHTSPLTAQERRQVAQGNFTPFAKRALEITRGLGYGRFYAAGYSLGTIAARAVELAGAYDMDRLAACYVGDAPNFRDRWPAVPIPVRVLGAYMFDSVGSPYKGPWTADGPLPRTDIARCGEGYDAFGHWFGNGNFLVNWAIGRGLSRAGLSESLAFSAYERIPTAISWSESKLMRGFEKFLHDDPAAEALAANGLLKLFRARKAPHISGENPVFLTDMMLRSVLFAQEVRATR